MAEKVARLISAVLDALLVCLVAPVWLCLAITMWIPIEVFDEAAERIKNWLHYWKE